MSKIKLTTVLWYPVRGDGRPIGPSISLDGVESRFPSVKFPQNGITFLYGHRNPAEAYLLKEGQVKGNGSSIAYIPVEIGTWMKNKLGFAPEDPLRGVEHTGFLSLSRAKADILDRIFNIWRRNANGAVYDPNDPVKDPSLFDFVIQDERFSHLKVIAYTVRSEEIGDFQVATVFDLSAINGVTVGHLLQEFDIVSNRSI